MAHKEVPETRRPATAGSGRPATPPVAREDAARDQPHLGRAHAPKPSDAPQHALAKKAPRHMAIIAPGVLVSPNPQIRPRLSMIDAFPRSGSDPDSLVSSELSSLSHRDKAPPPKDTCHPSLRPGPPACPDLDKKCGLNGGPSPANSQVVMDVTQLGKLRGTSLSAWSTYGPSVAFANKRKLKNAKLPVNREPAVAVAPNPFAVLGGDTTETVDLDLLAMDKFFHVRSIAEGIEAFKALPNSIVWK
ncbi:hypothetical protein VP01_457g15 [Puccinia sorghi]|uniref:Uncharacterized protein n=1 Tax=Puccinia sorghi TaxID=27349 RepID=A0A0L6UNN2_9BASI|nr:hypothetical protein VP01_457g15 [Puccinia sorghi]